MLEITYQSLTDVPEAFQELYSEKDGAFVLTGINGVKSEDDVKNALKARDNVKIELSEHKAELLKFKDIDVDKYKSALDENELLKAHKAGDKEFNLKTLFDARLQNAKKENDEHVRRLTEENTSYKDKIHSAEKQSLINKLIEGKVNDSDKKMVRIFLDTQLDRIDDDYLSNGKHGYDAGQSPQQVFDNAFKENPHWAIPSQSGKLTGSSANNNGIVNPFDKSTRNVTHQHKLISENPELAASMKASAEK